MTGHFLFSGIQNLRLLAFALMFLAVGASSAYAADMPSAAGSPIAGINFDDRPLMLPVQRNFQMAMLTTSSEMGRTCGKMEAYGWRLGSDEQARVNQIFNNTVDRLRAQGYAVETQSSRSVSSDVTLFTADREDKRLMFLWSAGEIGLVMVLCQTSAPLLPTPRNILSAPEGHAAIMPSTLPLRETAPMVRTAAEDLRKPVQLTRTGKPAHETFSPVGTWIGSYTCSQGTTGARLQIDSVKGDQFKGVFRFYPTTKNPYVPGGKYEVFGEYDRDSQRVLINPGKWLDRPKDYYNTIMIGSFDPVNRTFSAYFQGITGCTSFEAHQSGADGAEGPAVTELKAGLSKAKAAKTTKPAKKKAKKVSKPKIETKPLAAEDGKPSSASDVPAGIDLGAPPTVQ